MDRKIENINRKSENQTKKKSRDPTPEALLPFIVVGGIVTSFHGRPYNTRSTVDADEQPVATDNN